MRVSIDRAVCQGHGMCVMTAPALFEMDEREHGAVVDSIVPIGQEATVRRAALLCPEEAITVVEE